MNKRWGVAIGPTAPGDASVFNQIADSVDVDPKTCKVNTFHNFNFISVEVQSYDDMKEFAAYKSNPRISVVMVDINIFENLSQSVFEALPRLIKGTTVNFSRSSERLHVNYHYPPNVGTIIFLTAMYSLKNGIEIDSFNFSNCGITSLKGFTSFLDLFKNLKYVDLSGNPDLKMAGEETELIFGPAKIVTSDRPNYEEEDLNGQQLHSGSDENNHNEENYFADQPQLTFRTLRSDPIFSLNMFTPVQIDVDDFPTHRFVCNFLELMWTRIPNCVDYYDNDAVFSVISKESEKTVDYNLFTSNLLSKESPIQVVGRKNIIETLCSVFPSGFKAHPTLLNCATLIDNLYSVVIHGVFVHINGDVLGFDRSLMISFFDSRFRILNDNFFVRDPPFFG